MISIPFLDLSVPKDQYYNEAIVLNSHTSLKTITIEESLSKEFDDIVISDQCLFLTDKIKAKNKFLWVIEPPSINIQNYQIAYSLRNRVNLIFSHTKEFLNQVSNSVYCPWGSYFIKPQDHKVYTKLKNKTIIASSKTYAPGHKLRHEIISKFESKIDNIRRGGTSHSKYQNAGDEYKLNFIKDYRFSIEVENASIPGYFTEKILDCFRTGTVPIYYGDPLISDHFNMDGILTFSNLDELSHILDQANQKLYESKLDSIIDNYNRAENFLYPWKFVLKALNK